MIQLLPMQAVPPPTTPSAPAPNAPAPAAPPPAAPSTGTQQPAAPPGGPFGALCGGGPSSLPLMMLLMIAVFYFLAIRPQQKKQKEQDAWNKSLKKGDDVVTTGGLIGKISTVADSVITLEVADKVRIKVLRTSVTQKAPGAAPSQPAATNTNAAGTAEEKK